MKTFFKIPIFSLVVLLILSFGCNNNRTIIRVIGENSSNLQAIANDTNFISLNKGVYLEFYPFSFEDAYTKSNIDFATKRGYYDIILQYNFSLASFVENDYVYTLEELKPKLINTDFGFEDDIFPNVWKEVGYYYTNNEKPELGISKVGYPFAANTMLLVYNKNLFKQYADAYKVEYDTVLLPPRNWSEFGRIAKFFSDQDKNIDGLCLQGAENGWLYYEFCNFLYSNGVKIMDKEYGWQSGSNKNVNIDTPEFLSVLKYYLSLKEFTNKTYLTVSASDQVEILKKGKTAMAIVWSDYVYDLAYKNGEVNSEFGFAPIPGDVSPLAGGIYYINKNSHNGSDALKYIVYLMQPDVQRKLALKGLCSPLRSTYLSAEVASIPYSSALLESLERGVYMFEAGPDSDLISQVLTKYIQQVWSNKISAEDALMRAQEEINEKRITIFQN